MQLFSFNSCQSRWLPAVNIAFAFDSYAIRDLREVHSNTRRVFLVTRIAHVVLCRTYSQCIIHHALPVLAVLSIQMHWVNRRTHKLRISTLSDFWLLVVNQALRSPLLSRCIIGNRETASDRLSGFTCCRTVFQWLDWRPTHALPAQTEVIELLVLKYHINLRHITYLELLAGFCQETLEIKFLFLFFLHSFLSFLFFLDLSQHQLSLKLLPLQVHSIQYLLFIFGFLPGL